MTDAECIRPCPHCGNTKLSWCNYVDEVHGYEVHEYKCDNCTHYVEKVREPSSYQSVSVETEPVSVAPKKDPEESIDWDKLFPEGLEEAFTE